MNRATTAIAISYTSLKAHGPFWSLFGMSVLSIVYANLEAANRWLEFASLVVAISSGLVGLYFMFKKNYDDRQEKFHKEQVAKQEEQALTLAAVKKTADDLAEMIRAQQELLFRRSRRK